MFRVACTFWALTVYLILGGVGARAQVHPLMQEYNQAWLLTGQGKPDEAITLLKEMIARDKTFYRAYHGLAAAYGQKNEWEKAEAYFRELIDRDPANSGAFYGLSEFYEWKAQFGQRANSSLECIRRDAHAAPCYEGVAYSSKYLDLGASFWEEFERAIPADSGDPCYYMCRSLVLRQLGKDREAMEALARGQASAKARKILRRRWHSFDG